MVVNKKKVHSLLRPFQPCELLVYYKWRKYVYNYKIFNKSPNCNIFSLQFSFDQSWSFKLVPEAIPSFFLYHPYIPNFNAKTLRSLLPYFLFILNALFCKPQQKTWASFRHPKTPFNTQCNPPTFLFSFLYKWFKADNIIHFCRWEYKKKDTKTEKTHSRYLSFSFSFSLSFIFFALSI